MSLPWKKLRSKLICLLLLAALSNNLIWSATVPFAGPPYGAPDEIHHFEVARFIYQHRRIPIFGRGKDLYIRVRPGGKDVIDDRIYGWYAVSPWGAYILGAIAMLLAPGRFSGTIYGARLSSVMGSVLLVYLAYRIALALFPRSPFLHLGTPLLVALIPQVTFVNAYFNADVFTMTSTALVIYLWVKGMKHGFSLAASIYLGLALGLAALGRLNGWLISFVFTPLVLALSLRGKITGAMPRLLCIVAPPTIVFLSWFAHNYRYYGDVFAQRVFEQAWAMDRPFFKPYAEQGFNFVSFLFRTRWAELTFKSFWGVFGYMTIYLDSRFYRIIFLICVSSSLGLVCGLLRRARRKDLLSDWRFRILGLFALSTVLIIFASAYNSLYKDFQPQGRYLFPALIPICVLLLLGLRELAVTKLLRQAIFALIIIGLVLLNLTSFTNYILPLHSTPVPRLMTNF